MSLLRWKADPHCGGSPLDPQNLRALTIVADTLLRYYRMEISKLEAYGQDLLKSEYNNTSRAARYVRWYGKVEDIIGNFSLQLGAAIQEGHPHDKDGQGPHYEILRALRKVHNPLHSVLGEDEIFFALDLARQFRNRWKPMQQNIAWLSKHTPSRKFLTGHLKRITTALCTVVQSLMPEDEKTLVCCLGQDADREIFETRKRYLAEEEAKLSHWEAELREREAAIQVEAQELNQERQRHDKSDRSWEPSGKCILEQEEFRRLEKALKESIEAREAQARIASLNQCKLVGEQDEQIQKLSQQHMEALQNLKQCHGEETRRLTTSSKIKDVEIIKLQGDMRKLTEATEKRSLTESAKSQTSLEADLRAMIIDYRRNNEHNSQETVHSIPDGLACSEANLSQLIEDLMTEHLWAEARLEIATLKIRAIETYYEELRQHYIVLQAMKRTDMEEIARLLLEVKGSKSLEYQGLVHLSSQGHDLSSLPEESSVTDGQGKDCRPFNLS